jgi:hypothetical protein
MRHPVPSALLLCTTIALAGCGTLEYQGTSPSFRSVNDGVRVDDFYVGADANFAVVPAGETAAPPAAVARRDPLDIWNTPVNAPAVAPPPADVQASINDQ